MIVQKAVKQSMQSKIVVCVYKEKKRRKRQMRECGIKKCWLEHPLYHIQQNFYMLTQPHFAADPKSFKPQCNVTPAHTEREKEAPISASNYSFLFQTTGHYRIGETQSVLFEARFTAGKQPRHSGGRGSFRRI